MSVPLLLHLMHFIKPAYFDTPMGQANWTQKSLQWGFSLIELISIILLLSILSVSVFARFNINPFTAASFEQELRSAIRFAQKFATVSGCDVQVNIDAATNSYALNFRNDVNTTLPSSCLGAVGAFGTPLPSPVPGSGNFTGNAPSGVDITAGLTFFYDRQGRPSANGTITVSGQNIIIEPVTGYVH